MITWLASVYVLKRSDIIFFYVQAVLIANPHTPHGNLIQRLKQRIEGVLTAEKFVLIEYNISKEKLEEAVKITPGMKSPTITPLHNGWSAVKAMILQSEMHEKMDKLVEVGATDIFITHIHNCRV